jgi:hypothetical protein
MAEFAKKERRILAYSTLLTEFLFSIDYQKKQ